MGPDRLGRSPQLAWWRGIASDMGHVVFFSRCVVCLMTHHFAGPNNRHAIETKPKAKLAISIRYSSIDNLLAQPHNTTPFNFPTTTATPTQTMFKNSLVALRPLRTASLVRPAPRLFSSSTVARSTAGY